MKLLKWLFGSRKIELNTPAVIDNITYGERDEKGFCNIYVNGEKTNVRMLVWTEEDINRLHKIADEIHVKNNSK